MSESAAERRLRAQAAALTRWAREPDRAESTQGWRDGFTRKLEREIDPDGLLPPPELAVRVEAARRAHLVNAARLSVKARRERAEAKAAAARESKANR